MARANEGELRQSSEVGLHALKGLLAWQAAPWEMLESLFMHSPLPYSAFGADGQQLYQLAHGIDAGTIAPARDSPTMSRTRRFIGPLLDRGVLEHALADLAERLAAQLIAEGWAAGRVALTLTVDDGLPVLVEQVLAEPTSDRGRLVQVLAVLGRGAVLESVV